MSLLNINARISSNKELTSSKSKDSHQKRTSIKNGRQIKLRSLKGRVHSLLSLNACEAIEPLFSYWNRSESRQLLVQLKNFRRLLRKNPTITVYSLSNEIIAERMGHVVSDEEFYYGISLIPDYTLKADNYGFVLKMSRARKRSGNPKNFSYNGEDTNLYMPHPNFRNLDFLNEFIALLEAGIKNKKIAGKLCSSLKGLIRVCNSVLISICKLGFGRLFNQKSTYSAVRNIKHIKDEEDDLRHENSYDNENKITVVEENKTINGNVEAHCLAESHITSDDFGAEEGVPLCSDPMHLMKKGMMREDDAYALHKASQSFSNRIIEDQRDIKNSFLYEIQFFSDYEEDVISDFCLDDLLIDSNLSRGLMYYNSL